MYAVVCVCMIVCLHVWIHVCMREHASMYAYVCVCVCVCMRVCTPSSKYGICWYVQMYANTPHILYCRTRCDMLCCAVWRHATLCYEALGCAAIFGAMLRCALLWYSNNMLCYGMAFLGCALYTVTYMHVQWLKLFTIHRSNVCR